MSEAVQVVRQSPPASPAGHSPPATRERLVAVSAVGATGKGYLMPERLIEVQVDEAANLPTMHLWTSASCQLELASALLDSTQMQRTHVIKRSRVPAWKRSFRLASGSLATDMLRVTVLHEGSANMNEVIGEAWIKLAHLWKTSWADPVVPGIRRVAKQHYVLHDADGQPVRALVSQPLSAVSSLPQRTPPDKAGTVYEVEGTVGMPSASASREATVSLAFAIALPPRDLIPMHGWAAVKMEADGPWDRAWVVLDPFLQILRLWSDDDFQDGDKVTRILKAKLLLRDSLVQDLTQPQNSSLDVSRMMPEVTCFTPLTTVYILRPSAQESNLG